MKYTFLHLSDLHYRPNWHEESDLLCRKLGEDLKSQAARYENPFLVFSGDFVQAAAEPTLYAAFHTKIGTLLDEAGFPHSRRISIPGNHDVSRVALKPALTVQKGTLAEIKEERLFNNSLEQLSKLIFAAKF
jgi:predicted MPP superfamily phosphohydrolase